MALFSVTRYTGEEGNEANSCNSNENEIWDILNQKSRKKTDKLKNSESKSDKFGKKRKYEKGHDDNHIPLKKTTKDKDFKQLHEKSKKKHSKIDLHIMPSKIAKAETNNERVQTCKKKSIEKKINAVKYVTSENSSKIDVENKSKSISNKDDLNISKSKNKPAKHEGKSSDTISDETVFTSEIDAVDQKTEKNLSKYEERFEEEFTVIGQVIEKNVRKVPRVLPHWLAQPSVMKADISHNTTPLSDLPGIDLVLLKNLQDNGVQSYFPVQAQVIPALLEGVSSGFLTGRAGYVPNDICCSAPTGSGKTLAYVLPVIQALKQRVTCHVRALAVLPVQDLAHQVFKVFQTYCKGTRLKVACITGNVSIIEEQKLLVKSGPRDYQSIVDIVVATPGRLVDHVSHTKGLSLSHLRFLIIDEADRMMEEIKQNWLAKIETAAYNNNRPQMGPLTAKNMAKSYMPLQKLLFSATLSQNPEKLQQLGLFQPRLFTSVVKGIDESQSVEDLNRSCPEKNDMGNLTTFDNVSGEFVGKYTTPEGLMEQYYETTASEKPLAMLHFLHQLKYKHILCFTNSVETTHRLYWLLKLVGGIEVAEFSSRQNSNRRSELLNKFRNGKIDLLICSDAMARGMDVENVEYVISYESPMYLKTYIHRVGRTARAGKTGIAITLLENKEIFHFKQMMNEAGKNSIEKMNVESQDLQCYVKPLESALKTLSTKLNVEKKHDRKR